MGVPSSHPTVVEEGAGVRASAPRRSSARGPAAEPRVTYGRRVALIHQADLTPTKLELLRAWIPGRAWGAAPGTPSPEVIGAFRFDDPDGEVGIETHLVRTATGDVLQVPLTYRGAPLAGADAALVTTMEHSVLGRRWVYDGCADPVYLRALIHTIVTGGTQAPLEYSPEPAGAPPAVTTRVRGTGAPGTPLPVPAPDTAADPRDDAGRTVVTVGGGVVTVVRVVRDTGDLPGDLPALRGTWPGQDRPVTLAVVRVDR